MPIYEYQCGKCGKVTEVMQKISDPGPGKCPKCSSKKMQRVMSQTSFQLKGEGWYITDYSRKDKEKQGKNKKKDDAGGESSASSASTDKPDKAEKADKGDKAEKKAKKAAD